MTLTGDARRVTEGVSFKSAMETFDALVVMNRSPRTCQGRCSALWLLTVFVGMVVTGETMQAVRKGCCDRCSFDVGKKESEMAYTLGCLPGIGEIRALCNANGTAWACHSAPDKACFGDAARRGGERLQHGEGVC
jgi:hypothetical protein